MSCQKSCHRRFAFSSDLSPLSISLFTAVYPFVFLGFAGLFSESIWFYNTCLYIQFFEYIFCVHILHSLLLHFLLFHAFGKAHLFYILYVCSFIQLFFFCGLCEHKTYFRIFFQNLFSIFSLFTFVFYFYLFFSKLLLSFCFFVSFPLDPLKIVGKRNAAHNFIYFVCPYGRYSKFVKQFVSLDESAHFKSILFKCWRRHGNLSNQIELLLHLFKN